MKTAADYDVTFGYRAQDFYYYGPNGIVGRYHRGNDRPTPTGTPIVISGTTIGLTGATGIVSGSHLHSQACSAGSNYADDFDPAPFEFKNGTVVKAGWHNQFGNHVVIRVGKVDITYAHLSKINVKVGQVIGGNSVQHNDAFRSLAEVEEAYMLLRGVKGTAGEMKEWIGKSKQSFFRTARKEADSRRAQCIATADKLKQVEATLKVEKAKPPKETIKVIEKIVEKPVPVVTPIKPEDEREVVEGFFKRIWSSLFKK